MKNQNLYFSAKNIFPYKLINSDNCKQTINSYHKKNNDYFINVNSNNNSNYSTLNYNKLYNPIKDINNQSSYLENYFKRKKNNNNNKYAYSKNISDASSIETKQTEKISVKRSLISNNNSLLNSISQKEENLIKNLKIPSLKKKSESQKKINLKKFLYEPNKININNKIVNSINISFDKDMNGLDLEKLNLTNKKKLSNNSKKLIPMNDFMNYLFKNTNYLINNKVNTNNIKKVNNLIDSNNSEKSEETNKNNEFENLNITNDNDNIINDNIINDNNINNDSNDNKIIKSKIKIIHNYSYEYNHVYNNIIEKYNNYYYNSNDFKINNYYDLIKIQNNLKYVKTYYFFISKQEEIYIPGIKKIINIPKLKISEIKNINNNKENNLMSSSNRLNIKENGIFKNNNNITSNSNITSSIESIYLISDSQNKINPINNFIPHLYNNIQFNYNNEKTNFNNKITKRSTTLYYNNTNEKELHINNIIPLKTGDSIEEKNILENQSKNLAVQIPKKIISDSFINDDLNNLLTSSSYRNVINDLEQNIKNQIKLIEDKNKINKNNIILHLTNQNIFYLKLLKEKNKIKNENTIFYNYDILIQNFNIIIKMLNNYDNLKNNDSNLFNYDTILEILNENLVIIKDINKFIVINSNSKDN